MTILTGQLLLKHTLCAYTFNIYEKIIYFKFAISSLIMDLGIPRHTLIVGNIAFMQK